MAIILKKIPEDFRVKETQAIHKRIGAESGPYRHFSVRKKNYETFDVVAALSAHFDISRESISFSGLKDKDGVTEQYISVRCVDGRQLSAEDFNEKYYKSDAAERFMHIRDAGPSNHELVVADLLGNTFDMVVRFIDPRLSERLRRRDSVNFIFMNYYDVQRFGVPGGDKITHRIGEALTAKNYDRAIYLINRVADNEDIARNPIVDRQDLFARVDNRKIAFYLSSYSSFLWNSSLHALLVESIPSQGLIHENIDGVAFAYPKDVRRALPVICNANPYKYLRHVARGNEITATEIKRPEFIQLSMRIGTPELDEFHPGKLKCRFSFFLPSGCYATIALRQFIYSLEQD